MFLRKRDRLMDILADAGLAPTLPQVRKRTYLAPALLIVRVQASYFILADTTNVAFDTESQPPHTRDYDFCRHASIRIVVGLLAGWLACSLACLSSFELLLLASWISIADG